MTVRKLDNNGDIITREQQFTKERDEIAQTIRTRIKLFLGEYFRDISDGTPWFQSILTKRGTLNNTDAILRRRIRQTEGVNQIVEFQSDYEINTRRYSLECSVLTDFGTVPISLNEVI